MKNKIWLVSDTHFFHDKMIEYCNRPKDFNERLWKNLKQIKDDDILIHLGDINIGKDEEVHYHLNGILKCKKILVRGNHDHKSNNWYLEHGWDFVCYTFTDKYYGQKILFSHIPQPDNGYDINIHGHCHNTLRTLEFEPTMNDKQLLIAMENTNYQPVLLKTTIENYVNNKKLK